MNDQNDSSFEAITMDGGSFDSLTIERMEDGGVKLAINRDAATRKRPAQAAMCAEDVVRLAAWLTPPNDNALAAMTARAEAAEREREEMTTERNIMAREANRATYQAVYAATLIGRCIAAADAGEPLDTALRYDLRKWQEVQP